MSALSFRPSSRKKLESQDARISTGKMEHSNNEGAFRHCRYDHVENVGSAVHQEKKETTGTEGQIKAFLFNGSSRLFSLCL
jgi:hypothetical protein